MARPSNTDASVCIPRMLPWRDWDEWHAVKALLFSPEPCRRCQGVQHVAVWRSRERIPHAVETTSQLVEVRLNDTGPGGWGVACARRSEEELRLVYSTVVVRAVNGLTGHEQKTAHAAPVSSLAREIGLPTWLVDIRHEAAHKQLPGLVIFRLAADFLMDYLWRRYWAPQAEHLDFVWGAFDQLICRYKATSETDASLSCKPLAERSGSPLSASMGIGIARQSNIDTPSSLSTPSPAEAAATSPHPASKKRRQAVSDHPTHSAHKKSMDPTSLGAVAETVAREMACSVTPTALSWALLSLLADGGVGAKRSGGVGGEENAGSGRRRQGHLLPRSRDRYPTPGTPGVDDVQVGHRLTTRWAALLDIFHVRWQGFGAALLVRLVEALLANASRDFLTTPAPPTNAIDAGPAEATSSTGASRNQGGDGGDGIAVSSTASKNGAIVGLERQAIFIGLWVRHLLSHRWHMRSGDANIKEMLRTSAVQAGLSPDVCDQPETMWGDEGRAWVDQTAAPEVLRIAFFPVQELLARCRMSIATLGALPASATARNECREAKTRSENDGERVSHWANAGLEAVCCALEKALGGNGSTDFADEGRPDPAEIPGGNNGSALAKGRRRDTPGGSGVEAPLSDLCPYSRLGRDVNCAVSTGEPKGASAAACAQTGVGNEKESRGGCECDEGQMLTDPGEVPGSGAGKMMELDALERLLGGAAGLSPTDSPSISSEVAPTTYSLKGGDVSDGGTENTMIRSHGIVGGGRVEDGELKADNSPEVEGASHVGEGGAWDLVESWTPCAIGTLPGWSGAQLQFL